MTTIKPRDERGRIITNISSQQMAVDVSCLISEIDMNNWDCWNCEKVYNLETQPGKLQNCPHCGVDPVPF